MSGIEHNPFSKLKSEEEFEDLCRDLLERQKHLNHAQKLKRKGNAQYGIDITADIVGDTMTAAAQCKWYLKTDFEKTEIKTVVDHFLKYWNSFWKQKKVIEFYLMVARPKLSDGQYDEIQNQKERLAPYGIKLIDWWEDELKRELRRHPDLVREYLGNFWLDQLCPNEFQKQLPESFSPDAAFLINLGLDNYQTVLSEDLKKLVENIREKVRCGKVSEAENEFSKLKRQHFSLVKPDAQAELLSFEIRLFFPGKRTKEQSQSLMSEILKIVPEYDISYLDALIAGKDGRFEEALQKIVVCKNIQSLNLKLSLLLNLNRLDEFFDLFEETKDEIEHDVETRRLYAFALLSGKEIEMALEIIDEIASQKPNWETIKMAKAIIYYYQSVPRQFIPDNPLSIALPLPLTLIKTDANSRNKRLIAAELFEQILGSENLNLEQSLVFETWFLACLADDFERQNEAEEYCRKLLDDKPTHPYALLWSFVRNYRIDFDKSLKAFEEKDLTEQAGDEATIINEGLMHIRIYLIKGQIAKASRKLLKLKKLFKDSEQKDVYYYWNSQIKLTSGDEELVIKKHSLNIKNLHLRKDTQILALQQLIKRAKNQKYHRKYRRQLTRFLKKAIRSTDGDKFLPTYIEVCFQHKNYEEVVGFTERLVKLINNIYFAEIIILAHYHAGKFKDSLKYIDRFQNLYPNEELPSFIRHIKTYSLIRVGDPVQANEEAEKLFIKEKTALNYLTLFDAKRYYGDIPGIVKATEEFREKLNDLEPNKQLIIARTIFREAPEIAADIWRNVKKSLLENKELIGSAIFLGFNFGLGSEVGDLFNLVNKFGDSEQIGISSQDIDEAAEAFRKQKEQQQEINEIYRQGRMFTHIFAEHKNIAFTKILHDIAGKNAATDKIPNKFNIYTRNGSRFTNDNKDLLASESPGLFLDITSLIVLNHLEILDKLARVASINLPNKILLNLESEIESLSDNNPEHTNINRQIIEAFNENLFETVPTDSFVDSKFQEEFADLLKAINQFQLNLILESQKENAFVIFDLPIKNIRTDEVLEIPENMQHIRDYYSLIKAMDGHNLLTLDESESIKNIDIDKKKLEGHFLDIPINSRVFLSSEIINKFASLGFLSKLCRHFKVVVEKHIISDIKSELQNVDDNEKSIKWLKALETKIKAGLTTDYHLLSDEDLGPIESKRSRIIDNYRLSTLENIVRLNNQENSFVCVDDRLFSGYRNTFGQIPVVTTYEILEFLFKKNCLSESEYFKKLFQLKNENFRFIPVVKEELNFFLDRCSEDKLSNNGNVELSKLRQYVANCLLDGENFQNPPFPLPSGQRPPMELDFATGTTSFFTRYISSIWQDTGSLELAELKSNFIFYNFYTGSFGIKHYLPDYPIHKAGLFHQSTDIASLYLQGINFLNPIETEETIKRPKAYFNWLNNIFVRRLEKDEALLNETVNWLSNLLQSVIQRHPSERGDQDKEEFTKESKIVQSIYQNLIALFPAVLQTPLLDKPEISGWLEIKPSPTISIGKYTFLCQEIFGAITKSLSGTQTTVNLFNSDEQLTVSPVKEINDEKIIEINKGEDKIITLDEAKFWFNYQSKEERYNYLINKREFFDDSEAVFLGECRRLADLEDATSRFFSYQNLLSDSIQVSYRQLDQQIRNTGQFTWNDIADMPAHGLLKHYRLTNFREGDDLLETLTDATQQLIDEEGIEVALNKMARLPHPLPAAILEEIKNLPSDEKNNIIENARSSWHSPLGKLHYLNLALKILGDDEEHISKAKAEAEYMFSNAGQAELIIFRKILGQLYGNFVSSSKLKSWPDPLKLLLLWAHVNKIFDLLIVVNQKKAELHKNMIDYLNEIIDPAQLEIFYFQPKFRNDWLHPRLLERETFYALAALAFFRDGPYELVEKIGIGRFIEEVCFEREENIVYPKIQFLRDFSNLTNQTSSFLDSRNIEYLYLIFGADTEIKFSLGEVQDYFFGLIDDIKADVANPNIWQQLGTFINVSPLQGKLADRFVSLIKEIKFEELWKENKDLTKILLNITVGQKSILGEELTEKVKQWIKWSAWQLTQQYPQKDIEPNLEEIDNWTFFIADTAFQCCLVPYDSLTTSKTWNDFIFELGQIWHYIPIRLEHIFLSFLMGLSVDQNQNVWKNILLARSFK